jgi:hypothetical protein
MRRWRSSTVERYAPRISVIPSAQDRKIAMIYILQSDASPTGALPYIAAGDLLPDRVPLMGVPPVSSKLPANLTFRVEDQSRASGLADFMESVSFIVVSNALKQVLIDLKAVVEFIPISLQYRGQLHDGYFIANPNLLIEGMDKTQSDFELSPMGTAISIGKLVLHESKFEGVPMSVVKELRQVAVSEEAMKAIRDANCTGCKFVESSRIRY